MNLLDLFEKTRINIEVLGALADEILSEVRYSIDYGHRFTVKLNPKFAETIRTRYGDAETVLAEYITKWVPITFINIGPTALGGSYQHYPDHKDPRMDAITVFLPQDPANPQQMMGPRQIQKNTTVKSTLMHEMRHVAQRTRFGEFYQARSTDVSDLSSDTFTSHMAKYKTDPLEIDAAFTHIINNNSHIDDPRAFAKQVIDDLSTYKQLTDRQRSHYFRKAAAYAYDRANPNKDQDDLSDRLVKKQTRKAYEIKAILNDAVQPLSRLSQIGMNPSGFNTSFPGPALVNGHIQMTRGSMELAHPDLFITGASMIYKWIQDTGINLSIDDLFGKVQDVPTNWWSSAKELIKTHQLFQRLDREFLIQLVDDLHRAYRRNQRGR
jgi:hypothetical protein